MSLDSIDVKAAMRLKSCRDRLTTQEYRTLRGLIYAGNSVGAMKGLKTILAKANKHN